MQNEDAGARSRVVVQPEMERRSPLVNIPGRVIVAPPQPAANFRMRRHPEIDGAIERGVAPAIL